MWVSAYTAVRSFNTNNRHLKALSRVYLLKKKLDQGSTYWEWDIKIKMCNQF